MLNIVKLYLEFLVRQFPVSVFVREVEHLVDVVLGDGDGQTPHDVLEVALGDEVFVQFVLFSTEIGRKRICPTDGLR